MTRVDMEPGTAGARMASAYYDEQGRRRKSARPVPVDQFGRVTGVQFRCTKCGDSRWFPNATAERGDPLCERCNRRMARRAVGRAALLPWSDLWRAADRPLRAVWAGGVVAAAGLAAHTEHVPGLALLAGAVPAGVVASRVAGAKWTAKAVRTGHIDPADPSSGKRMRSAISRRARHVGYCAAGAVSWTALAATAGMDPSTFGGKVSLAALFALWLYPAATWWRYLRNQRRRLEVPAVEAPVAVSDVDPTEAEVRRIWRTVLGVKQGQIIGRDKNGEPVKAERAGRLPGTDLEDWQPLPGGWGATIVGPVGEFESDQFIAAIGKIASAFSMKKSMITVMPDAEDENRSMLIVQRTSPINDVVRWPGPESIDATTGRAPWVKYTDGTWALYELWRNEWGCPHDFVCGTTGAGKSEALSTLLLIDRWTHITLPDGTKVGLVADLLIDPQQGQSYGPFLDDLAAPVATSLDEGKLVVGGVRQEMFRRNKYLATVEWVDSKGRKRKGRKWWNPLIDGPLLVLNIDEAHEFLADKEFAHMVTSGSRMFRKCGIKIRVVTHTPLLADLGGSTALRSMLTGGGVWVGRTADSLSGGIAFNGRLPVDPRTIPETPGLAFAMSGVSKKAMLGRTAWEPDYYDWVRDDQDQPIGYPAELPAVTWAAFGDEFAAWVKAMRAGEEWVPAEKAPVGPVVPPKCVDSVLSVLSQSAGPLDMDGLDAALRANHWEYSTRTVRGALKQLRDDGLVFTSNGRHELTPQARADVDGQLADAHDDGEGP